MEYRPLPISKLRMEINCEWMSVKSARAREQDAALGVAAFKALIRPAAEESPRSRNQPGQDPGRKKMPLPLTAFRIGGDRGNARDRGSAEKRVSA